MTKLYGVSGCVIICVVSCCVIICVVSCFVNKNSFRVQLVISYDQTMRTGQQSTTEEEGGGERQRVLLICVLVSSFDHTINNCTQKVFLLIQQLTTQMMTQQLTTQMMAQLTPYNLVIITLFVFVSICLRT